MKRSSASLSFWVTDCADLGLEAAHRGVVLVDQPLQLVDLASHLGLDRLGDLDLAGLDLLGRLVEVGDHPGRLLVEAAQVRVEPLDAAAQRLVLLAQVGQHRAGRLGHHALEAGRHVVEAAGLAALGVEQALLELRLDGVDLRRGRLRRGRSAPADDWSILCDSCSMWELNSACSSLRSRRVSSRSRSTSATTADACRSSSACTAATKLFRNSSISDVIWLLRSSRWTATGAVAANPYLELVSRIGLRLGKLEEAQKFDVAWS